MRIEWKVDKESVRTFVNKEYGIKARKIEFVPKGEVSYGYVLTDSKGKKFFAKIFPNSRIGKINSNLLDFSLRVTFELYAKCGINRITYPIMDKKGKLKTSFEGMPLVLFDFIEGKNKYKLKMDNREISNLAQLLAKIHKCLPRIKMRKILKEDFKPGYKKDLLKSLKELKDSEKLDNKYKRKLAKMIEPVRGDILDTLEKVEKLGGKINKKEFVICHTDAIESNLIIKNKEVFIIDWDGVLIAPKEHDLWFYLKDKRFLKAYEKEFGKFKLDKKAVFFYIKDRVLEDLTDLLVRILHDNDTDKQNKRNLFDIKYYCQSELKIVDKVESQYERIVGEWNEKTLCIQKST
jgi:spectinomycin phosphotransferase